MKLTRQNALKFALFVCIFSLGSNKIADFDIWYHTKTGEYILTHFTIPHHDIFSYSTKEPWVAHEWLSQVILYLAYKTGGFRIIILFRALILCLVFGLLFRIVSRRAQTVTHQIFSVALAIIVSAGSFLERPQLFSYLLFIFLYEQLTLHEENKKRALWHFIPLFTLWVNLHSSFILGLFLILFFTANEGIKAALHDGRSAKARHLGILLLLCSLSSLVSPNHIKMFLYPFETLLNKQHMDLILEWQSPDFHIAQMQFAELFIFLTVAGLAAARSRIKGIELFLLFFFLHFALYSRRNLPFFAFVCAPILAACLEDLMKAVENTAAEIPVFRAFYALDKKASIEIPALNMLIFIFLVMFLATRIPHSDAFEKTVHIKDFPVKASEFLKSHPQNGNLFNEYDWGGYLIFALYPKYKVFIDGRMDIHMKTTIPDYLKIMHYEKGWENVVKKHNMRLFLLRRDNILSRILQTNKNFSVLYKDKTSILFIRE